MSLILISFSRFAIIFYGRLSIMTEDTVSENWPRRVKSDLQYNAKAKVEVKSRYLPRRRIFSPPQSWDLSVGCQIRQGRFCKSEGHQFVTSHAICIASSRRASIHYTQRQQMLGLCTDQNQLPHHTDNGEQTAKGIVASAVREAILVLVVGNHSSVLSFCVEY